MRKYTDEQFINAVKNNFTISDVLNELKLKIVNGNYRTFYNNVKRLNLTIDHFTISKTKNKSRKFYKKIPIENILIYDSQYKNNVQLKNRLLNDKILENKCSNCNLEYWLNNPITLQLDHINGINNDNRLENLRILCPNCHSQTDTYAGKNIKQKYLTNKCKLCEKLIKISRVYCKECFKQKLYIKKDTIHHHGR